MWVKGFKRVNMMIARGSFVSNAQPNHPEKNSTEYGFKIQ